ncbi:MAG: flagellar hook-length control protein FliK [Campylobacterales bacterium]|nr:flagellar hook-length control protein FliK [Campylobacterales bacterium]
MIRANTAKTQNIILPSTNKALARALQDLSSSQLGELTQAKDLASVLNSILKEAGSNEAQNQRLLELLKNNTTLKELGSIKTTFKELLGTLENEKQNLPIQKHLRSMLEHISNINDKDLKAKVDLQNDLRSLLAKTKTELENATLPNKTQLLALVDKLSLQLDYYQLNSQLLNGTAMYLPYDFDMLEQGSFEVKKEKNDAYFCDINLSLQKYGELHLRLGLFEKKYLNINIQTQNKELKNILSSDLQELKEQLNTTALLIKDIRFIDPKQTQYSQTQDDINLGFEVKI